LENTKKIWGINLVLEKLYDLIVPLVEEMGSDFQQQLDNIYKKISIENMNIDELMDKSDQDIKDFISQKETDTTKKEFIFELIQKVKIEQSLESLTSNIQEQENADEKSRVREYFSKLVEPDSIDISDEEVKIVYNFKQGSKLKDKLNILEAWNKENVLDTISKKLNILPENITMVDKLGSYIDFISTFEEMNYVSRGQKDCMYDLVPSLHRIYDDGFKNHSSQFESDFRQKVLYYDNSIENKDTEELRAYAQHFGLPTNYLDFTEAHLISLLFAVEEFDYQENHSIVYFVDALSYNKETIRDEIKLVDFSDKELKKTKEKHYADKSYFIRVGNSNERIHFQKGCFLKVEPNDSLDNMLKNYTKVAIIDRESKKGILRELFNLGITFENIYPDKDNMVKTIKFVKNQINQL
jgi:hypothetical protein